MTMAAVTTMMKAKLMQKGAFRPEKMVSRKMPDGSALLARRNSYREKRRTRENVKKSKAILSVIG